MGECAECDFCIEMHDGTLYCGLRERVVEAYDTCDMQQEEMRLIDGDIGDWGRFFGYEEDE